MKKDVRDISVSAKQKCLLWAVIEFAVVIALVVIGIETERSFPHELAHCSSSCRMSSGCKDACCVCYNGSLIRALRRTSAEEIEEETPLLTRVYDLVITSPEKVHAGRCNRHLPDIRCVGYTSNEKTDETKGGKIY